MSVVRARSLWVQNFAIGTNVTHDSDTVPTGYRWKVEEIRWSRATGGAGTLRLLLVRGASAYELGSFVTSVTAARVQQLSTLVLEAGDVLRGIASPLVSQDLVVSGYALQS